MTKLGRAYLENTEMIIESLENLYKAYKSSLISFMQDSRLRETAIITSGVLSNGLSTVKLQQY